MDPAAFQAVRGELPLWVGLAPILIWAPASWVVAHVTLAIGVRVTAAPLRCLPADSHWSERARHAFPVRVTLTLCTALTAVLAVLAASSRSELSWISPAALAAVVGGCALAASLRMRARLAPELVGRASSIGTLLRDDGVTCALLLPHLLLPLALSFFVRVPLDGWDALRVAALAGVFVGLARAGVLDVLALLRLTEPVPPRLLTAVAQAARSLGAAMPRVAVVRWGPANAFAFPFANRLAFSSRCVESLSDQELAAVAAHEIGHLGEPWRIRLARGAALFALLPLVGLVACIELWGPLGTLAPLSGMLLLVLGFRGLASRMEQRADQLAHAAGPPEIYARALERLYVLNAMPAVMSGRPVHPHLYDRLQAAGITPDFPRPAPPSMTRMRVATLLAILWLVPASALLAGLPLLLTPASAQSVWASDLAIGLERGCDPLLRRALLEHARGNGESAVRFADAAIAADPLRHEAYALAAMVLAGMGRCDDASDYLFESEALALDGAEDAWVRSANASLELCATQSAAVSRP